MKLLSQRDIDKLCHQLDVPYLEKLGRKLIVAILQGLLFAVAWGPYAVNVGLYFLGWGAASQYLLVYNLAITATWLVSSLRLAPAHLTSGADKVRKSFTKKKCLVVGAGPVGLCTTKELIAAGHEVACYDIRDSVGGLFAYSENKKDRGCYASTRLTSSPKVTSFSDFPPPADEIEHWSCGEYVSYLDKYVDHFGFRDSIHLEHRVVKIRKDGNRWRATIRDERKEEAKEDVFDHVAVCSGLHRDETLPKFDGASNFEGEIVHVNRYKSPSEFAGKRVVVVGLGESAADVSGEIAQVAKEAYLSARKGTLIIPRMNEDGNGLPKDYETVRIRHSCGVRVREATMWLGRWFHWTARDCDKALVVRFYFLQRAGVGAVSQTATKSDTFVEPIIQGKLKVKPQISRLSGNEVHFVDGSRVNADVIICCTGYQTVFPFLEIPEGVETIAPTNMYRYMFHPRLGSDIVWLGYARPTIGAIPPIGELQARWFAKVVSGNCTLPDQMTMEKCVAQAKAGNMKKFPLVCPSYPVTEFIPYLDLMANEIGCRPSPQYLLSKPKLLWKVLTGPALGAHYRLNGLPESEDAEKFILDIPRAYPLWQILVLLGFRITFWPLECMGMEIMQSVAYLL